MFVECKPKNARFGIDGQSVDNKKRSTLITLGMVGVGYAALRYTPALIPQKLELVAMETPRGFRKLVAGESSTGSFNPLIGLIADDDLAAQEEKLQADARVGSDICAALYLGLNLAPGQIPIASFSDYYCPFCRVQTQRLAELSRSRNTEIAVAWHELPLLGESSYLAAKAALAAKRQGAYVEFQERLMRTPFVASTEYLHRLSSDLGVDEERLLSDMNSEEVAEELQDSAALSRAFALVGTPALVIGRTAVQGLVSDRMIERIIQLERNDEPSNPCSHT